MSQPMKRFQISLRDKEIAADRIGFELQPTGRHEGIVQRRVPTKMAGNGRGGSVLAWLPGQPFA